MMPVLWSFRRCPYAMRARLAIHASGQKVELREILLRDKPTPFLKSSPKGTVPVLEAGDEVLEESFDIMLWALRRNDPERWLDMPSAGYALIEENDGPFKTALDRTKYHTRYEDADPQADRAKAAEFLWQLDAQLSEGFLFGPEPRLADMALLPFVRQFANIDRGWFDSQGWSRLSGWLAGFFASDRFVCIMTKRQAWQSGDSPVTFPA